MCEILAVILLPSPFNAISQEASPVALRSLVNDKSILYTTNATIVITFSQTKLLPTSN